GPSRGAVGVIEGNAQTPAGGRPGSLASAPDASRRGSGRGDARRVVARRCLSRPVGADTSDDPRSDMLRDTRTGGQPLGRSPRSRSGKYAYAGAYSREAVAGDRTPGGSYRGCALLRAERGPDAACRGTGRAGSGRGEGATGRGPVRGPLAGASRGP